MGTLLKLVFVVGTVVAVLFFMPGVIPQMKNVAFNAAGIAVNWAVLSAVVLGVLGLLYLKVSTKH